MNSSRKQQSFSSYSQDHNNEPHPSEEDKFSEYEEKSQLRSVERNIGEKSQKIKAPEKRRYSYGKNQERSPSYNYLDSFNDIQNSRPGYYTSSLKNPKPSKYVMGIGSPSGVGAFDSSALLEYEKYYLSGLNKYYKSHNYNQARQPNLSISSSVDRKRSFDRSFDRSVDRSEYWNGQKFDYFAQKERERRNQINFTSKETSKIQKQVQVERNVASGSIVNKKDIKEIKKTQPIKPPIRQSNNNYIRIEEDFSATKNFPQTKQVQKQTLSNKNDRQALKECALKPNITKKPERQETEMKFQSIEVKSKESILMQKEYSALLSQKNELAKQNVNLLESLKKRETEIQSIAKMRITDNEEYTAKIEKLKNLFQTERKQMIRSFQEQISIYKCVRKEAIKNELIMGEQEKVNLIMEKNKLESELKKVDQELISVKQQLSQKNLQFASLEQKIKSLQSQVLSLNQTKTEPKKDLKQRQDPSTKNQNQNQNKNQLNLKSKEPQIPEWMSNFLIVFKNMVVKLLGNVDPTWSDKRVIIIGWKVVKIMIEKAVKIGVKVPQVVNETEVADCSIISQSHKPSGETKKYNLPGSKKPIRI